MNFGITAECRCLFGQHERCPGHRFDTTADAAFDAARPDRVDDIADGIHPRPAQPVYRGRRHGHRQSGQQRAHATNVAVVLASLVGAAIGDIVDRKRIKSRVALDEGRYRNRTEIIGPHFRQRAAVASDRRPDGIADERLRQITCLPRRPHSSGAEHHPSRRNGDTAPRARARSGAQQ